MFGRVSKSYLLMVLTTAKIFMNRAIQGNLVLLVRSWSTGATTNNITVTTAGTYNATCTVNACTSISSNSIIITDNGVCPPCPQTLTLQSPADDYSSVKIIKETNATTGTITATNKISSNANITYRAGKNITLNPTFQTQSGSIFKAEIGGCN